MLYSKQKFFCMACGVELQIEIGKLYGGKTCGRACFREFQWRETLSIMGKEYKPDPDPERTSL